MSAEDMKDVSLPRLWRRVKAEIGLVCGEKEDDYAMKMIEAYHNWKVHEQMRRDLDARRAADPKKHKPIPCNLCD